MDISAEFNRKLKKLETLKDESEHKASVFQEKLALAESKLAEASKELSRYKQEVQRLLDEEKTRSEVRIHV